MNNTDNHTGSWSITDVQEYLRGQLPPAEMHRLEKLALDDPFLADALEGLQTHAPVDPHLTELRTRLEHRITRRHKLIRMSWPRIAAAVSLLVGLGLTAWYTLVDKNRPAKNNAPVARIESHPVADTAYAEADTARAEADTARAAAPAVAAKKTSARPADIAYAKVHRAKKAPTPAAPPTENAAASSYAAAADASITTLRSVKKDTTIYPQFKTWPAPAVVSRNDLFDQRRISNRIDLGLNRSQPPPARLLVFSGRVLDGNNRPVAGAALFFNGNAGQPSTFTDHQGKFNLYLPLLDTTRHLTVALSGYENAEYLLDGNDRTGNTIYLRENPARLDEVVVTGYGARRKETLATAPSDEPEVLDSFWLKTAPVMGRIAYLDYLARAKKDLSVDTAIRGTESISFLVDQKGTLSEFKIEHSLSPAHDAGLIHLISDGPPWKMIRGKKARAVVTVSFP